MKKYSKTKYIYISPTDKNNKIRFIIYNKKFKAFSLVFNNSFPPTKILEKKNNVIYQFKCPLGESISDNKKNIYIGYTTTKLSRRLSLHLSDSSSICQHLKKYNVLMKHRNILVNSTKILHVDKNVKKLKILEALYIRFKEPTINRINFEPSW